jgi:hypothetical protein
MHNPRPIRTTSIARHTAWLLLWLMKHAWELIQGGPQARRDLRRAIKGVACLIVIRATQQVRPRHPGRLQRPQSAPRGFASRRGAPRLRFSTAPIIRRLRRRSVGQLLTALFNAVLFPEQLTALLVKRIKRGFTRLHRFVIVRPPVDALASLSPAPAMALADTS